MSANFVTTVLIAIGITIPLCLFVLVKLSWLVKNRAFSSGILLFAYINGNTFSWLGLRFDWFGFVHVAFCFWIVIWFASLCSKQAHGRISIGLFFDKLFFIYIAFNVFLILLKGSILYTDIIMIITIAVIYFCIVDTIWTEKDVKAIIKFGLFGIFFKCMVFLFSFFQNINLISTPYFREHIIYSPNGFSVEIVIWVGLVLYNAKVSTSKKLKLIYYLVALAIVCCTLMAGSRIALICLMFLILAFAVSLKRKQKVFSFSIRSGVIGILIVISFISFSSKYDYTMSIVNRIKSFSLLNESRFQLAKLALGQLKDHPLFGVGSGFGATVNFDTSSYVFDRDTGKGRARRWNEYFYHAHNWYIQVLLDTGLVGLFFLISVIVIGFKTKFKVRRIGELRNGHLILNLRSAVIGLLILGFFQNLAMITSVVMICFLFLRMCQLLILTDKFSEQACPREKSLVDSEYSIFRR